MDLMIAQGQAKVEEMQFDSKKIWVEIQGACPGIDLENVIWAPHPSEDKIVPLQAKFNTTLSGPTGR